MMKRTAERIKKDVVDSLFWDTRIDASSIKVMVQDGTVILTGSVPTFEARRCAEEDAWIILGVDNVRNQLAVSSIDKHSPVDDADLAQRIECVLAWDADVNAANIRVSVNDGIVRLHGRVRYLWEKVRAERRVSGLAGVTGIVNDVEVSPPQLVPDEIIATGIADALARNLNAEAEAVRVEIRHGHVTLSGMVSTPAAQNAAVEAVRFTDGVVGLRNRIAVRGLPAPNDAHL